MTHSDHRDSETVRAAVADANRTLEQKWTGSGLRYRVVGMTVRGQEYDEASDELKDTAHYLIFGRNGVQAG